MRNQAWPRSGTCWRAHPPAAWEGASRRAFRDLMTLSPLFRWHVSYARFLCLTSVQVARYLRADAPA